MRIRGKLTCAACLILATLAPSLCGGPELKVFNLDKLNTAADEDDPFTLADGVTLLYATKKGTWDIYLSRRTTETGAWPAGKPLLASTEYDERSASFHKATNRLYFANN